MVVFLRRSLTFLQSTYKCRVGSARLEDRASSALKWGSGPPGPSSGSKKKFGHLDPLSGFAAVVDASCEPAYREPVTYEVCSTIFCPAKGPTDGNGENREGNSIKIIVDTSKKGVRTPWTPLWI